MVKEEYYKCKMREICFYVSWVICYKCGIFVYFFLVINLNFIKLVRCFKNVNIFGFIFLVFFMFIVFLESEYFMFSKFKR